MDQIKIGLLKSVIYPPRPEPIRVEIEPTNICNAKCVFCPRQMMIRPKGYLDVGLFSDFLDRLYDYRATMWLNERSQSVKFPRLVFAGLGEPTLHPQIVRLVYEGKARGFETELVTNGSLLNTHLAHDLASAGLSSLAISLHSLDPHVFSRLSGLELESVLPRVVKALEALDNTNVNIEIWRVGHTDGSRIEPFEDDQEQYTKFLTHFKKHIRILGPTPAWNRGGQLPSAVWPKVRDSKDIWCHLLYFTLNVSWEGTAAMCCCDYSQLTTPLGNAWCETIKTLQDRRYEVFKASSREQICKNCRRPRDRIYQEVVLPTLRT